MIDVVSWDERKRFPRHFSFYRTRSVLPAYNYSKYYWNTVYLFQVYLDFWWSALQEVPACSWQDESEPIAVRRTIFVLMLVLTKKYQFACCSMSQSIMTRLLITLNCFLYLLSVATLGQSCRQICLCLYENFSHLVVSNYENFHWSRICSINIHRFFENRLLV